MESAQPLVGSEIRLAASLTKTHGGRTIGLEVSPAPRKILAAMNCAEAKAWPLRGGRGASLPRRVRPAADVIADLSSRQ